MSGQNARAGFRFQDSYLLFRVLQGVVTEFNSTWDSLDALASTALFVDPSDFTRWRNLWNTLPGLIHNRTPKGLGASGRLLQIEATQPMVLTLRVLGELPG
jgi:hypothetical protein